jgi:toxoflavin synthase
MTSDNDQFTDYGTHYDATEQWPLRSQLEAPSFLAVLGDLTGRSILDAGCGSGFYLRRYAKLHAGRLIGLDPSEGMLAVARQDAEIAGLDVTFVQAGLAEAGLLGPVDLVTAVYVLPYATSSAELAAMCRGAAEALRPGGRFVAFALNPDFASDPEYYRPYGFTLDAKFERGEGQPVILASHLFDPPAQVVAHRWSRQAHDDALREAGFRSITWSAPHATEAGIAEHGAAFWADYLSCPHALIVSADRP